MDKSITLHLTETEALHIKNALADEYFNMCNLGLKAVANYAWKLRDKIDIQLSSQV